MKVHDLISELKVRLSEEGPIFAETEELLYFRQKWTQPEVKQPPPAPKLPEPPAPPPPVPVLAKPQPVEPPQPPAPVIAKPQPTEPPPPPPSPKVPPLSPVSFEEIRRIVAKVAPQLKYIEEIPSDALAKKIAQRWKTKNQATPISLLSLNEPKEHRLLLDQIAIALDVYFGPASLIEAEAIEKEKQWETFLSVEGLKLVVVCDYTLWQLHHLMKFYKETPAQNVRMLGSVPVLLLPDLSLYLKDPELKRSLWKALCQKLSS